MPRRVEHPCDRKLTVWVSGQDETRLAKLATKCNIMGISRTAFIRWVLRAGIEALEKRGPANSPAGRSGS